MKAVIAIYFVLFLLIPAEIEAKCEKASTTFSCSHKQSTDEEIKAVWSNDINYYMAEMNGENLSSDIRGDSTGLGIRNLGIYKSDLSGIQSGYFGKITNGVLEKLVFMNVKLRGKLRKEHFTGLRNLRILEIENGPEFEMDAFDDLPNLKAFRINNSTISLTPSVVNKMLTNNVGSQIMLKNTKIEDFSLENLPDWFRKPQSSDFDIEGSPMRCDSSMVFLRNAFNSRDSFMQKMLTQKALNFVCQSPPEVKGKKLADISEAELMSIPTTTRPPKSQIATESSQQNNANYGGQSGMITPDRANENQNSGASEAETLEGAEGGIQQASAIGIGVAFAVLLLLIILAVLIWFCCKKKAKKQESPQEEGLLGTSSKSQPK